MNDCGRNGGIEIDPSLEALGEESSIAWNRGLPRDALSLQALTPINDIKSLFKGTEGMASNPDTPPLWVRGILGGYTDESLWEDPDTLRWSDGTPGEEGVDRPS